MTMQASSRERYLFIDGLRAAAIMWVLIHHAFYFFDMYQWLGNSHVLSRFARNGLFGVDLFFVISGFLITGLLLDDGSQAPDLRRFYTRRFFKIYPQYASALLFCLALPWIVPASVLPVSVHSLEPVAYLKHFFLVQNYYGPNLDTFGNSWSLAVEEHFYLIFPLIVWLVCKCWSGHFRRVALGIVLLGLIAWVIWNRASSNGLDALCRMTAPPDPAQATLIRVDAILVGCMLKVLEPLIRMLPRAASLFFAAAALSGYTYLFLTSGDRLTVLAIVLSWMSAAGIFMAGYLRLWGMRNALETAPVRWVGRQSYGIYLWHYPLIFVLLPFKHFLPAPLGTAVFMGIAVLVGYLSTMTIEKYALALRQQVAP